MELTGEQKEFITCALAGNNILVDACVGSGKTTAIQNLCMEFPRDKKILYLTYNKLLKIDAKEKIKGKNVNVTNYHGFAFVCLKRAGINAGISDLIQKFNNLTPPIGRYDLLVLDEYQDIDQEIADMLMYIKQKNVNMQIVAVGDMRQKIYDKTTLDIEEFIESFIGKHTDLEFTKCFRLCNSLAEKLGRIWEKKIVGVNEACTVIEMPKKDIIRYLAEQNPADILCLGSRNGLMSSTLNVLEEKYTEKYNKTTVYASISDNDRSGVTEPTKETAIFTTYDSSKGLERRICVVFDFTESYWAIRRDMPQQKYEILRNIFCVAASRGKEKIVFVRSDEEMLSEQTLSSKNEASTKLENVQISAMFDFKYKEDVESCFSLLKVHELEQTDRSIINIKSTDGLIDLSPCIGIYQEAVYFDNYQIDEDIKLKILLNPELKYLYTKEIQESSLDQKILFLVSLETKQKRYRTQVILPFVNEEQSALIIDRLKTRLNKDEKAQVECRIDFSDQENGEVKFFAKGFADVVKDNIVYELKFVSELTHEHFLQCACYMVAMNLQKGILWNTRDNTSYEIEIPERKVFLNAVAKAVTKGAIENYYVPVEK